MIHIDIDKCIKNWNKSESEYRYQLLKKNFSKENYNFKDIEKSIVNSVILNTFYSTNINRAWEFKKIAEHIAKFSDMESEIRSVQKPENEDDDNKIIRIYKKFFINTEQNEYSFTSKFLHFCNENFYIIDSRAGHTLSQLNLDYTHYNSNYENFVKTTRKLIERENLQKYSIKEIDHYLWWNGGK